MNSNQTSSQPVATSRISFSNQPLQNGVISIASGAHQVTGACNSTILTSSNIPISSTIKTITTSGLVGGTGVGVNVGHLTTAVPAGAQHIQMQVHQQQTPHQITHHQVLNQQISNSGNHAGGGTQQQNHQTLSSQSQQQQSLPPTAGATPTQTLVIKSNHAVTLPAGFVSNAPGIVNMTKTLQQQQSSQPPLINSMLPANVVVGVRQTPGQQPAKGVPGNAIGRVVIGGAHVVNNRPNSPAITLSTLSAGQAPALILKTENGFQLLRVGPANTGPVTQTIATNSTNSTQIRLQTVPATSMTNASAPINTIVNSVSTINTELPVQQVYNTSSTNISLQQPQQAQISQPSPSPQQQSQVSSQQQQQLQSHHLQPAAQQIQQQIQQSPQTITSNVLNTIQTHQQQFTHNTGQQTLQSQQPQITQIQTIPAQSTNQLHQTTTTTMTTQQAQHQLPTITNHNSGIVNNMNGPAVGAIGTAGATAASSTTPQNAVVLGNTKEKCRKFLANLIDLSTREPKPVERNVRSLIQELINANVEPEDFCDRLERLLNASPQPCLIGFLKKSLPLLRHALFTKELVIEGIKPPPQQAVIGLATIQQQFSKIQAQIRPISHQTATIGQTQVRMISPATVTRPICHPAISKNTVGGLRIQTPANTPRLLNAHIRGSTTMNTPQIQTATSTPNANIVQLRTPVASSINRSATVQIRSGKGKNVNSGGITTSATPIGPTAAVVGIPTATAAITNNPASGTSNMMHIKVGQTQIKAISSASPSNTIQPPSLVAISNNITASNSNISSSASILSTINSVATNTHGSVVNLPVPSLPTVQLPPALLAQQQQLQQQNAAILQHSIGSTISNARSFIDGVKINDIKTNGKPTLLASVPHHIASINTSLSQTTPIAGIVTTSATPTISLSSTATLATLAAQSTNQQLTSGMVSVVTNNKSPAKSNASSSVNKSTLKKKKETVEKEREEAKFNNSNTTTTSVAMSSFYQQPSLSMSSYGDDDINDVAAMGGVNLAEESQRILGCTENIGTQIRSCKDEVFLNLPTLQARLRNAALAEGLEEPSQDVAVLLSHACQERLKTIVEKLVVIAEHRIDVIKLDPRYEVSKDVRGQIKFLEELDKAEQKRHEELEREILLRAAKSRSKVEDPEQAKMKARAKEMQRAEMEELRQRDANMTALQAIGPRKKLKTDNDLAAGGASGGMYNSLNAMGTAPPPLRPRIKRVNLRDMIFFMEQERDLCRSEILYRAYLK